MDPCATLLAEYPFITIIELTKMKQKESNVVHTAQHCISGAQGKLPMCVNLDLVLAQVPPGALNKVDNKVVYSIIDSNFYYLRYTNYQEISVTRGHHKFFMWKVEFSFETNSFFFQLYNCQGMAE